jgi:hypothetical protein
MIEDRRFGPAGSEAPVFARLNEGWATRRYLKA